MKDWPKLKLAFCWLLSQLFSDFHEICKPYFLVIWHLSWTYWIVQEVDHLTCHAFLFMTINHYLHHSLSQNCVTCQTIKFFKVVAKCIVGAADKSPSNKTDYFRYIWLTKISWKSVGLRWDTTLSSTGLRDLVKSKKSKNPRKTRIGLTPTTHPSIQLCFFLRNMYSKKTTQENTKFPKKRQIRVGTWPTHPLPCFSRIFGFFLTWQVTVFIYLHSINQHTRHVNLMLPSRWYTSWEADPTLKQH